MRWFSPFELSSAATVIDHVVLTYNNSSVNTGRALRRHTAAIALEVMLSYATASFSVDTSITARNLNRRSLFPSTCCHTAGVRREGRAHRVATASGTQGSTYFTI